MKEIILKLLQRDLEKLKTEITSFKDEKKLWKISGDIKNSAGNLCLAYLRKPSAFYRSNAGQFRIHQKTR